MLQATESINNMLSAPVRKIQGRVELFNGSTLDAICTCHDALSTLTVERTGAQGKFFGFGICHKLSTTLIDMERTLNVTTAHHIEVEFGVDSDYIYPFPHFYIESAERDETTNEINITAYDALYKANNHTVAELPIIYPYSVRKFMETCASFLGVPSAIIGVSDTSFNTTFEQGANFDGSETIRAALDAIAEVTQTIYYIDSQWRLVFKRLSADSEIAFTIGKEDYFTLESGKAQTLSAICHATELGDNIKAAISGADGVTQYVRNNPFWELRTDTAKLVNQALSATGGLTIGQFICEDWGGNFLLEIGDKIALIAEDNSLIVSYLLDDALTFNGTLSQTTQWTFAEDEAETDSNPTTLGDALNKTYARVDKLNQTIDLISKATEENTSNISALQITTKNISSTVSKIDTIDKEVTTLKTQLNQTANDLKISIDEIKNQDVQEVITSTGFTFNNEGLTIDKTSSDISTKITENGMTISKEDSEVLTANNTGVQAANLHATTYLIVGNNSRFEDYNESRTGCFWIN